MNLGKISFSVLRIVLASYAGLCLYMYLFQSRYVYYPTRNVYGNPGDVGLDYEDLHLQVGDDRINAWAVAPPVVESTAAAAATAADGGIAAESAGKWVLFCHGNAGNLGHRLDTIKLLHELGFGVVAFDYRGYGKSDGKPTETNTYADARAVWQWLTGERGVAPADVIVFGRSLGGAVAAELASWCEPGALVLDSAFTSIPDMAKRFYPYLPVRLLARIRYPTLEYVGKVKCPVLIMHSSDDEIVPVEFGRRLYQAAPAPRHFVELAGGHNETTLPGNGDYRANLAAGLAAIGVKAVVSRP